MNVLILIVFNLIDNNRETKKINKNKCLKSLIKKHKQIKRIFVHNYLSFDKYYLFIFIVRYQ